MEPTGILLFFGAAGLLIALIVLAHLRREKKRREWHETLAVSSESPPLNVYRPPDPAALAPIVPPMPAPKLERAERAEGSIASVLMQLPDMRDDWSASAPQRQLLKQWLGAEFAFTDITRRQASLVLDICAYLNGLWWMKAGEDPSPALRAILLSEILADEEVWRGIRTWGRGRYSSGRDSKRPTLAPNSALFGRVWAVVQRAATKPGPGVR